MNLKALIQANLKNPQRKFQALTNKANDEATIYVYDVIDAYWGVSAKTFAQELAKIDAKTIHLRINSPGGDVFEARAIAVALREHKSKVIAHVDGYAASAASYIALAADEVEIADGAMFMIHKAWTIAFGNSDDLTEMAGLLDKIDADLVRDYVANTGNTEDQVKEWMAAETWFTADEAVENGFADRKSAEFSADATARAGWDVSAYKNAPKVPLESAAASHDEQRYMEAMRIARTL
jgi:ATP-dependent Clp protease, protease subunit